MEALLSCNSHSVSYTGLLALITLSPARTALLCLLSSAASSVGVDLPALNAQLNAALRCPPAELHRIWSVASSEPPLPADSTTSSATASSTSSTASLLRCLLSTAKVSYCVSAVQRIRSRHPDDKVVVFSQFTRMLDVLQVALQAVGVGLERFDGSQRSERQQAALDRFDSAPPSDCACLLISLHAGGVGLNLTRASHCLMVDAWYNPAIEQQAHDRVHRLSQTKPVFIQRCVVKGAVEEQLLNIQHDKDGLAQAALGRPVNGSSAAGHASRSVSLDALQQLFRAEAAG